MRSATFRGKRWAVEFRRMRMAHGECDHPKTKGKKIKLDPSSDPLIKLDTAIHEGLHAALWDLEENAITEISNDITRFLIRLIKAGYLRVE